MDIPPEVVKKAREAAEMVSGDLPLMALTGAGISVESSIPPFRGPGGLWERYDPYDYGHIDSFERDPFRSWKMLIEIINGALGSEPNEAHMALARMEKKGWISPLVTQNVDGLHKDAGSVELLEVHGNARRLICMKCGMMVRISRENWNEGMVTCKCGGIRRPDIVFFGEPLPDKEVEEAFRIAGEGRSMIIVGTSGIVHPIAMLPYMARASGARIIEVNPLPSEYSAGSTDVLITEKATTGMAALEMAFSEIFS